MTMWRVHQDAELRRLHRSMTLQAIADHFGVSRRTIGRQCVRLGLSRARRHAVGWTPMDTEDLRDMLLLGYSVRRMSRETGYSRNYIEGLIKRTRRGLRHE